MSGQQQKVIFHKLPFEDRLKNLKARVDDFQLLRLPGQPMGMHMGTAYLVQDLWSTLNDFEQIGWVQEVGPNGYRIFYDDNRPELSNGFPCYPVYRRK